MERLNLNVPPEIRAKLKAIARHRHMKEAEAARVLLVEAVERAEREAFERSVEHAQTPELRQRLRAIAAAMEKLGAGAR